MTLAHLTAAAGLLLWALAKAYADADMWRAVYGDAALISQRVRNWHTLSLLEDIGAGILGIGATLLWLTAGPLRAIMFCVGGLALANVLFRAVYVRLMFSTWDVTSPAVNRTALPFFVWWRGRDRALALARAGAIIYYAGQLAAGAALVWFGIR